MNKDIIIKRDCMECLPELESESVDLIILDPNYNDWDGLVKRGLLVEVIRVLKKTGNIICFTKQPFDYNLRISVNPYFRREIAWSFENGGAWVSNRMPLVSFQKLFWLVKGKDFYFNPRTGLDYSKNTKDFKRSSKVFEGYKQEGKEFKKSNEGVWMRDHFHYNKPMMGKIPAKPLELMEVLIRCLTKEGDTVLDPFIGSGTTAVAAIRNGRHYIGYEVDDECLKISNKRIEQYETDN